jgi:ornithine decarboxylase
MTFDNEFELRKIAKCCPQARLVIRIAVDDSNSVYPFGNKFGATNKTIRKLFQLAQDLKLTIVGVSFHVGCRVTDERAYSKAILRSKDVFTIGEKEFNLKMTHLDIGGGFPGTSWHSGVGKENMFDLIAQEVNSAIDKYFPVQDYPNLKIISEPGTYYCASSMYLAVQVIARRVDDDEEQGADSEDKENVDSLKMMQKKINNLYINEGMFGTFLAVQFDYPFARPIVLLQDDERDSREIVPTTIWGQTCDGTDKVFTKIPLPELDIGEWLLFRELGDYTLTLNTPFNGFTPSGVVYHAQDETLDQLKKLKTWPLIEKRLHGKIESIDQYMHVRKLGPN